MCCFSNHCSTFANSGEAFALPCITAAQLATALFQRLAEALVCCVHFSCIILPEGESLFHISTEGADHLSSLRQDLAYLLLLFSSLSLQKQDLLLQGDSVSLHFLLYCYQLLAVILI